MEKKVYNQEETSRDNRKVEEAGVAYGACPEAAVHASLRKISWEEVRDEMVQRYPEILDNPQLYREMKDYWEAKNHFFPYMEEEIQTRFRKIDAEVAAGSIRWKMNEEVFHDLERVHPWLQSAY